MRTVPGPRLRPQMAPRYPSASAFSPRGAEGDRVHDDVAHVVVEASTSSHPVMPGALVTDCSVQEHNSTTPW